ncbi:cytochrome c [Aurantimonas sp. VKM B-3413]|uniref:c-type cytochrome n=1 Tax=Aurantimonas sp. VKM B-3413 TaxID=2779401 RepID=UPI001E285234|nr:cytochrome c [Aurantimonas sp. VKM B-3413]MCB8836194.1 cytochrome c [Aurantimonas sp. VKM B-3413]
MRLFRLSAAAAAIAISATALSSLPAGAQNDSPIEQRQKLMKENGKSAKAAVQMIKGEAEYSPEKAKEVFTSMHEVAMKFGDYFPQDSKTGHKTEAAPAIWDKPEEFKAALAKFQEDTAAAMDSAPADRQAFQQVFGKVAQNCKSCHEDFRVEKD